MSLCGLLRGTGVDEAYPRDRGQVEAGKFSAEGNADGGGIRHPADVGGRSRDGDLFLGVFKKGCGQSFVGRFGMAARGTVFNGLGSG